MEAPYYLDADRDAVAEAIAEVAGDLPQAKEDARALKALLIEKLGCSWALTARKFLDALATRPLVQAPGPQPAAPPRHGGARRLPPTRASTASRAAPR